MLEINEYYVYISQPSKIDVSYVGEGKIAVMLDNSPGNTYHEAEVKVYSCGLGQDGTEHFITEKLGTKKSKISGKPLQYSSDGSKLPAKYLGEGAQYLHVGSKHVQTRKGYVFELYTVPIVLSLDQIQDKIHPTEVAMTFVEQEEVRAAQMAGAVAGGVEKFEELPKSPESKEEIPF